ncbi:hypothetical protein EYF80_026212 [Liparis tanakae]|uniref:Uncharacterized protein n=1 Tax=Liparis tanakae TaxID=230148 RepID=A0A4Z2HDG0_9TELE|nr:hypothetical protein EYF80_026212 [Liparis tanakae]
MSQEEDAPRWLSPSAHGSERVTTPTQHSSGAAAPLSNLRVCGSRSAAATTPARETPPLHNEDPGGGGNPKELAHVQAVASSSPTPAPRAVCTLRIRHVDLRCTDAAVAAFAARSSLVI